MLKSLLPLILLFVFITPASAQHGNIETHIMVNGQHRDYIVNLPHGKKSEPGLPVVFIFHGGGGNAIQMQRYMDMDAIAARENFITVYPQGIKGHWNDGREVDESITKYDDAQFISQVIDSLVKYYSISTKRVFATGISNGGFMSIYLSYKLSDKFLAVAPVCATIPQKIYDQFYPANPVSLLLINGTKDPLVKYEGGIVGNKLTGDRGESTSTDSTIARYISVDKTAKEPQVDNLPNRNKFDGCEVIQYTYDNGASNTTVSLVKVINGGHALPGASQYLPKFVIGKVCRDFDANQMIWEFFKNCKER